MPDAHAILANSVDRLLARFGKDCELLHSIPGTYNPQTGSVGESQEITYTARAIESGYELAHLADTLIEAGNKVGILKITDPAFTGQASVQMRIHLAGDHPRNLREVQPVTPGPRCLYWRFVAG